MAVSQPPALVSIPHPLVADGREVSFAAFLDRETLGAYIERTGVIVAKGPVAVWHNGRRVLDELWTRLIPKAGDQVVIRARAEGGGGGNKVLRTVALVVVAIAAVYTGGAAAAAYGGAGTLGGAAAGAAASAAVSIAGSLVVSALIPLPKPNVATTSASSVDSSPSYQIQASRNTSRPWEPMLLVMGGPIKVVPDLGSNPSTSYVGDDQYLAQIFHFGVQPDMAITDLRIGDTPIESFQGVQIQRSGWDGAITLAPDNVDTIQGFDLNEYDGWNMRTTPVNTAHFEIEFASILFSLDTTTGAFNPRSVVVQVEYRAVGAADWIPFGDYTDPVYATHYWAYGVYQHINDNEGGGGGSDWMQISYGSLNPDDHINGEQHQECQTWGGGDAGDNFSCQTFEWRWLPHPFQLGRPWQGMAPDPLIGYQTSEGLRFTGNSNKPVRSTWGGDLPPGQYEFRIRKVTPDINTNTDSNVTSVTQIRAYQYTPTDYSYQARLAVRIRATSQLNGPIDELSAMCAASCNVWNGSSWVYGPTRNPAWWFLWFAFGFRTAAGEKLFGACLPESQIDVEGIKAWGAWCDYKGWTFDYVLAQKMSVHDVLTMIARAGQASYSWQSGRLGVVWDAANLPAVAMIGPYNIKAGTFEVSYVDGTVDEIIGNFINKDRDWQADQVRVRVPDAPLLNNPQTFDLEGIIDQATAGRAVNLVAASQNFHRRRVSWEMDIEGYIATRGDIVQVSHDLTVWGYAGRLKGGNHSTLILDRSVPVSGAAAWLTIREPYGAFINIQVWAPAGETDTLTILSGLPTSFPMPDNDPEISSLDWAWQFDPLATPGRRLKIVSVQPTNDDGVRFEAVDDDPDYYASETNPYAYTPPRDGALLRGIVFGLTFSESVLNVQAGDIELRIGWVLSSAMRADVNYTVNGTVFPTVSTLDRYIAVHVRTGDVVTATVTPVGSTGNGVAKTSTWVVTGLRAGLPAVIGLTSVFRDGLTWLSWSSVNDVRNPGYEIRVGPTYANARVVAVTNSLETLAVGNGLYWVAARFDLPDGNTVYGAPDSLLISGATLVRNVVFTQDEAPDWTGTLSGGAYIYDGRLTLAAQGDILSVLDVLAEQDVLWYGGPAASGIYTNAASDQIDIGFVCPVKIDFDMSVQVRNLTSDLLNSPDIFAVADVLSGSDLLKVSVVPQIRTAQVAGEWTDWRDYVPGLLNARYFDVRLVLSTADPLIIPFVSKFEWTVDVPDLVQRAESVAVPVGGLHITYAKRFHAVPNVQITILGAVANDRVVLTASTEEGFNVAVMNGATSVARNVNWISQGY